MICKQDQSKTTEKDEQTPPIPSVVDTRMNETRTTGLAYVRPSAYINYIAGSFIRRNAPQIGNIAFEKCQNPFN